jgi:hypothetical protein
MRTLAILTLLAACGDNDASNADGSGAATRITVVTDVPAGLVAYRDGDGAWQTAAFQAGRYELDVHGPYRVAAVCDYGDGTMDMLQVGRTPDDDREISWTCLQNVTEHQVTGTMVQAGRLFLGLQTASVPANAQFTLDSASGARDVVAMSPATNADHIAIRRITVTGATVVTPPIDIAQEGAALLASPFTATNASGNESLVTSVRLRTKNETLGRVFNGGAAVAKIAPTSVLAAEDVQSVTVSAVSPTGGSRSVSRSFREGDATRVTLPDALGGVQFTAGTTMTAAWTALPEHEVVSLSIDSLVDNKFWFHGVELSARFIAATGATSATIDTDLPGFKPAWKIDFATQPYTRTLDARRTVGAETQTSSQSESLDPASQRRIECISTRRRHTFPRTPLGTACD